MRSGKAVNIHIPDDLFKKLKVAAEQRGVAKKWMVVSAIEEFLAGSKEENAEPLRKQLSEVNNRLKALRGDVEILGELLSYFIFHWIGYTPRLEKAERASLVVEAKERHERFMTMFARKLALGELSLSAILARGVTEEETDDDDTNKG